MFSDTTSSYIYNTDPRSSEGDASGCSMYARGEIVVEVVVVTMLTTGELGLTQKRDKECDLGLL